MERQDIQLVPENPKICSEDVLIHSLGCGRGGARSSALRNSEGSHEGVWKAQAEAMKRFDIEIGDYKYGELTVDTETDQMVANAHVGKELADEQVTLVARKDRASPHYVAIAHSTVNNGGRVHLEGTLTAAQLDWIHANGDDAIFFVRGNY
ncbi:MAG: hypothetical protein WBZ42_08935 [Halobacteriota archaeon]